MNIKKYRVLINAVGFQAGWWLSVLGVMVGLPMLGPVYMLLFLGMHYMFFASKQEFYLILLAGVVGTVMDSLYTRSGMLSYGGGYEHIWLAPLWITTMWLGFTATLNHALDWLRERPLLGFLAGAIFGPLSYYSGQKLGVISFHWSAAPATLVLALVWGLSIPLLYMINRRLGVVK